MDHGGWFRALGAGGVGCSRKLELVSGEVQRLTPDDHTVLSLDVDPTGHWVVYAACTDNDRSKSSVWYVDAEGLDEPQVLLAEEGQQVSISHDGKRLLMKSSGSRPGEQALVERFDVPEDAPWHGT